MQGLWPWHFDSAAAAITVSWDKVHGPAARDAQGVLQQLLSKKLTAAGRAEVGRLQRGVVRAASRIYYRRAYT